MNIDPTKIGSAKATHAAALDSHHSAKLAARAAFAEFRRLREASNETEDEAEKASLLAQSGSMYAEYEKLEVAVNEAHAVVEAAHAAHATAVEEHRAAHVQHGLDFVARRRAQSDELAAKSRARPETEEH